MRMNEESPGPFSSPLILSFGKVLLSHSRREFRDAKSGSE